MITYNDKNILKSFIGNKRLIKKYLNNKIVYGTPDFAQYYNIQGYDNYKVVGNPTIVDNVIIRDENSATDNDYVKLPIGGNIINNSIEFGIKFRSNVNFSHQTFLLYCNGYEGNISVLSSKKLQARVFPQYTYASGETLIGTTTILPDTIYYVKYIITSTKASLYLSTDNKNYNLEAEKNIEMNMPHNIHPSIFFSYGTYVNSTSNYCLDGQIYLSDSYIKIDGNYWFNGNPNYKELLDCNPNVYLQSSGTQYIDTDISGVVSTELDAKGVLDNLVSQVVLGRYSSGPNFFGQYGTSKKWGVGSDWLSDLPYINRGKFLVNFNSNGISFTYNGITYNRSIGSTKPNRNIFIFACNDTSKYYANANIYSLKIYNSNNELIRNFVPVPEGLQIGSYKVPSNSMFDIVEQKFYENKGSGEFIWGVDL